MNKIDFLTCATTWSIFVENPIPRAGAIRRTGARPPVGGWGSPPSGGLHLNNTE